jgi:hypothetical protein
VLPAEHAGRVAQQDAGPDEEVEELSKPPEAQVDRRAGVAAVELEEVGDQVLGRRLAQVLLAAAAQEADQRGHVGAVARDVVGLRAPAHLERAEPLDLALDAAHFFLRSRGWQRAWTRLRSLAATWV